MTDRELLAEYVSKGSERAFAEIVERHLGRVLATCLRALGNHQEAEDAAQAVFLLLVKKAGKLSRKTSLSGWLYLAARNVALNARKRRARRARHEREASEMQTADESLNRGKLWTEVQPELDTALAALSGHQRNVVVLRYFYGKDQKETAEELGCSRESVALAASRGLAKLRDRLASRGASVPVAALGALLLENCTASVPAGLTGLMTAACLGKASAPATAIALAEGAAKAMTLGKIKLAAAVLCAVTTVGAGGGFAANRLMAGESRTAAVIEKTPKNKWGKLDKAGGVSAYSAPAYVPTLKSLVQWKLGGAPMAFDGSGPAWKACGPGTADLRARLGKTYKSYRFQGLLGKYGGVMNAACWDSKRKRLIFCLYRMTVAYDPGTKTWEDLKAKAIINGKEFSGGPPVFGRGACYDPVNDEVVMFPHWVPGSDGRYGRHEPSNRDRVAIDGRVSNHLGTMILSLKDNTWRRVASELGSPEVKKARKELFAIMKTVSDASDGAYGRRRGKGLAKPDEVVAALAKAVSDVKKLAVPATAKADIARAANELEAAAAAAKKKDWDGTVRAAGRCLWILNEEVIDGRLRVEPPPRCTAPMVYLPEKRSIVMFGGRGGLVRTDLVPPRSLGSAPGRLNDTWVYDCASRQWREQKCSTRPPELDRPNTFYHPGTKSLCLLDLAGGKSRTGPGKWVVWSLDFEKKSWNRRLEGAWPWGLARQGCYASSNWLYESGFDPERRLLIVSQTLGKKNTRHAETYVMKLDLASAPSTPAPPWKPRPPLKPQSVPAEDSAWVAKLKSLPANKWVPAKPPQECGTRGWGNVACDPVRGQVYYFGGGHSTYQINDVAIYAVGANRWSFATGDHNDFLPPTSWGGIAMGYRGGKWAHHQRNQYVALDGRMFVSVSDPWFYDLDRGGVWRQRKLSSRKKDKEAVDESGVHVVSPDGRVMALLGQNMVSRMADSGKGRSGFSSYDVYANTLEIRKAPGPFPSHLYEHRPLCFLPDRNQIFFYEHAGGRAKLTAQRTWIYDIKTGKWIDLKPKKSPFKGPGATELAEYIQGQDAVWCVLRNRNMKKRTEYWVYSFKRNSWTCMTEQGVSMGRPYGQAAYVAKYGVLVAVTKRTRLMRVDVEKLNWK